MPVQRDLRSNRGKPHTSRRGHTHGFEPRADRRRPATPEDWRTCSGRTGPRALCARPQACIYCASRRVNHTLGHMRTSYCHTRAQPETSGPRNQRGHQSHRHVASMAPSRTRTFSPFQPGTSLQRRARARATKTRATPVSTRAPHLMSTPRRMNKLRRVMLHLVSILRCMRRCPISDLIGKIWVRRKLNGERWTVLGNHLVTLSLVSVI